MRSHRLASLGLAAALAGCGPEFDPPSLLDDLRVLALISDPLEVGPGEEVHLTPVVHVPAGQRLARQSWSFCPFSAGAAAGFVCAVPRCEVALSPGADGVVHASPTALAQACLGRSADAGSLPVGLPGELPEQVELLFRYRAEADSGLVREAVARVPLWTSAPPRGANRSPVIAEVRLGGEAAVTGEPVTVGADEELEVAVLVDPASLDTYVDASGRERAEEAIVSFYATAGRFAADSAAGSEASVTWRAGPLAAEVQQVAIYVVARDLRGGQAVWGPLAVSIRR